jgi:glucose/arabinose dehydrogenase
MSSARLVLVLLAAAAVAAAAWGLARAEGEPTAVSFRRVTVARGLDGPLHVAAPRNETDRIYVVEQVGRIRVIVNGRLRARPFLDIRRLVQSGGEQGLLSVAFHPAYRTNRRLYVDYTDRNGDTRVVEYRSDRAGTRVLTRTRRQLLFVRQPYPNHNGGQLAFGPDGYLYVGMGDGGSGGDPENRAQNLRMKLGKLLRINVNRRRSTWQIVGYGLRNPWRFSFDRATGDLWIGDVGQSSWEEIDHTPRRSPGLENYGWDVYEGRERFERKRPNPAGHLVFPVHAFGRAGGNCSVTGGFVYRGAALSALRGRYVFGDYCSAVIWSMPAAGGQVRREAGARVPSLSSFGEDANGELYATSLDGEVYRFVP